MRTRLGYVREYAVFAMLGTIMFISKLVMEFLPNIHLVGILTIVYTLTYRVKALIPIYVCVILNGLYFGFSLWWVPYLYIWTILWGVIMLFPKGMSERAKGIACTIAAFLHGLLYGILYAPAQALMFHLNFEQMIVWIIQGIPFDITHAIGNLVLSVLIIPLTKLLHRLSVMINIIEADKPKQPLEE